MVKRASSASSDRRIIAAGTVGAAFGTAAAAGPALGGVLVDVFDWRAIFLVNLPIVVVALGMVLTLIPADRGAQASERAHGSIHRVLRHADFAAPVAATAL